jgi:hypothetical protein
MAMTDNKWRTTTANNVAKREARQCCGCAAAIDRTAIDTLQCVTADCSALCTKQRRQADRQTDSRREQESVDRQLICIRCSALTL